MSVMKPHEMMNMLGEEALLSSMPSVGKDLKHMMISEKGKVIEADHPLASVVPNRQSQV